MGLTLKRTCAPLSKSILVQSDHIAEGLAADGDRLGILLRRNQKDGRAGDAIVIGGH